MLASRSNLTVQSALDSFHFFSPLSMPGIASIECDLINAVDGQKLRTVRLSVVPRIGEELDLDFGENQRGILRVVQVRYHIRPRKLVRTDDIIGVSVFVAQHR